MSKTKELFIDPTQDMELEYLPDWNNGRAFVIRDSYEALAPFAEALQEADKALPAVRRTVQAPKVAKAVVERLAAPVQTGLGRFALDIETKAFDVLNRTDLYGEMQRRRRDERVLRMATRIGLVAQTRCAKHEKALASMRGMK